LEALACGCYVFSSVNGGLSDYLDPGFNCDKIAGYSLEYDVQRILKRLKQSESFALPDKVLEEYRSENIIQRFLVILDDINNFFDYKKHHSSTIESLTKVRLAKLLTQRIFSKIKEKYLTGKKR
jgi:hypothetical protein